MMPASHLAEIQNRTSSPLLPRKILENFREIFIQAEEEYRKNKASNSSNVMELLGKMKMALSFLTMQQTVDGAVYFGIFGAKTPPGNECLFNEFLEAFDKLQMKRHLVPQEFHDFLDMIKKCCKEARLAVERERLGVVTEAAAVLVEAAEARLQAVTSTATETAQALLAAAARLAAAAKQLKAATPQQVAAARAEVTAARLQAAAARLDAAIPQEAAVEAQPEVARAPQLEAAQAAVLRARYESNIAAAQLARLEEVAQSEARATEAAHRPGQQ